VADEAFRNLRGEPVIRVAAEEVLPWQPGHHGLNLIVKRGIAPDIAAYVQRGSVLKPLVNLLTPLVISDNRGATDNGLERKIVVVPEPAKDEERKA
jgi:hypothetical protein